MDTTDNQPAALVAGSLVVIDATADEACQAWHAWHGRLGTALVVGVSSLGRSAVQVKLPTGRRVTLPTECVAVRTPHRKG